MLRVEGCSKHFGGLKAVNNVEFNVKKGEIKSLIGPNGAGKTTLFNVIAGALPLTSGTIYFEETKMNGMKSHQVAKHGIIRTFQNIKLFSNLHFTVRENLLVGSDLQLKSGFLAGGLRTPKSRKEEKAAEEKACRIAQMVGLEEWLNRPVSELTSGFQRLLELGRALMAEPKLLLLDEPAAGLNDSETQQLIQVLSKIREMGVTILLVEHHMGLVMTVSDSIVVMNNGIKIAEGNAEEIQNNRNVIEAYIGEDEI
jgi:branched-chain amino acid transport system ATP-binding protein